MSRVFTYHIVRADHRDLSELAPHLPQVVTSLAGAGVRLWGAWRGLFGVSASELVLMTIADAEVDQAASLGEQLGALGEVSRHVRYLPTVRPTGEDLDARSGLYVFRQFDVAAEYFAEVAELSRSAWETFEHAEAYQAEPQGLFKPADATSGAPMLLLTWYDGFDSWLVSRRPSAEARENFARRRQLTNGTHAIATEYLEIK